MRTIKIFIGLLLLSPVLSCHKSHSVPATSNCRIASMRVLGGSFTDTYTFSYNSDGKLSTVQYSDSSSRSNTYTRTFTYGQNLIVCATTGSSTSTDSVFLDGNGQVSSIRTHNSALYTYTFTRDNSGQLLQSAYQYNNGTPVITTYQYTNGDATVENYMGSALTFSYYTDKNCIPGDLWYTSQWMQYGVACQKNAHLMKSQQVTGADMTLNYSFDTSGKITGITATTAGTVSSQYQFSYVCN